MEPPAGLGAEGGGGGAGNGARVRQRAEGEVHLTKEAEILATTGGRGGADDFRWGDTGLTEPLPQGTGLTATRPGVGIEAEELDALGVPQSLAGQLSQSVIEEEEHCQAAKVTEGPAVHLSDAVVVEEKAIEVDQAAEHVLWKGTDTVAMQEQLTQVDEVRKDVILQEVKIILLQIREKMGFRLRKSDTVSVIGNIDNTCDAACEGTCVGGCMCFYVSELSVCMCMAFQRPYLQIKELQTVKLVEDVMGQGSEPAAVHVEALELLKATEGSPLQPVEVRVIPQVQLLQVPQLTKGPCLNPRDVVGKQPQNLRGENIFMKKIFDYIFHYF